MSTLTLRLPDHLREYLARGGRDPEKVAVELLEELRLEEADAPDPYDVLSRDPKRMKALRESVAEIRGQIERGEIEGVTIDDIRCGAEAAARADAEAER